jgi:hypothetical protein
LLEVLIGICLDGFALCFGILFRHSASYFSWLAKAGGLRSMSDALTGSYSVGSSLDDLKVAFRL